MLGAQHQNVWLHAQLLKLLDGVLRRLRLIFFGGRDKRHIRQMYAKAVASEFPFQLTHTLDKRQRLDVTHRPADFGNHHIELVLRPQQLDVAFNLVRDVRDHLYCLAQIFAASLLLDYALIDTSRGDAVGTRSGNVQETLVMTKIKVGLMSVDGYETFAVLVGIECSRIDVDVRVELLNGYFVASRL